MHNRKRILKLIVAFLVISLTGTLGIGVSLAKTTEIEPGVAKDYLRIGFDLMKNEKIGILRIGLSDQDAINAIGEPEKKGEAKVWQADGLEHQTWYYPSAGIQLNLVRKMNKSASNADSMQAIERIIISTPCVLQTSRGIGIGSTTQEVQAAYGNEINPKFSVPDLRLVAGTVYGGIIFKLQAGVVSSIFIGAAAE